MLDGPRRKIDAGDFRAETSQPGRVQAGAAAEVDYPATFTQIESFFQPANGVVDESCTS
jgi:hypothetical protein